MRTVVTTLLLLLTTLPIVGQQAMFQWRDHLPYRTVIDVTQSDEMIYAATPYALIEVNKSSGEVSAISKTNFLSGLNISAVQYIDEAETLLIGYESGNLDIFTNNVFYNMPDIKLASVQGSKAINDIHYYDGLVYLSCDFGIVVINAQERNVKDSYFIRSANVEVHSTQFANDSVFAFTDQGVFKASADNPYLRGYDAWTKDAQITQLLGGDENFNHSIMIGDKIIAQFDDDVFEADTLYEYNNGSWSKLSDFAGREIKNLSFDHDKLIVSESYSVTRYDAQYNEELIVFAFPFSNFNANAAIYDGTDFWIGTVNLGVVKAANSYNATKYEPEGPYGLSAFNMHYQNDVMYVAAGSQTENWQAQYSRDGIYIYEEGEWRFRNFLNTPEIDYDTAYDFLAIGADPNDNNHIFIGTASEGGLYEIMSDGMVNRYTKDNSTLQDRSNNPGFYGLTDLYVDSYQTLWVANAFSGSPLVAKDVDDNWYSFSLGSAGTNALLTHLYVDYNGVKWVSILNKGLAIFDDNETLDDTSDDQLKMLSSGEVSGNLPNNIVTSIIMDLDNEVWVGTTEGFAVFYSPEQLFDDNTGQYGAQRVLIDGGENTEAVLGKTYITAIDVDGANRKWIATKGAGVFCLSPDGKEEVYHFTVDNSPLFSNNVESLKVNHKTGEVFLGTDFGMLSFRADATYGDDEFSDVKVFPNPVTPDYSGPITIQGLGFNTDVKITDIAGNLVYKGPSNGGTFVWDGQDLEGNRVKTGVYLVIAGQTGEPKGKNVSKIMFIN